MGYDYFILYCGTKDGIKYEINHREGTGSYGASYNHYLFQKRDKSFSYTGYHEMGKYCFIIDFETVKGDYEACEEDDTHYENLKYHYNKFVEYQALGYENIYVLYGIEP